MTLFVYPGSTVEADVPVGDYYLYYASGETWCGPERLFGPDTACKQADDLFDFYYEGNSIVGHAVELIEQFGGNLDTVGADAGDFQ